MLCHLPLFAKTVFRTRKKNTPSERKNILVNFEICHFQTLNTSKCALKQGDGNIASGSIQKTAHTHTHTHKKNSWITNNQVNLPIF